MPVNRIYGLVFFFFWKKDIVDTLHGRPDAVHMARRVTFSDVFTRDT